MAKPPSKHGRDQALVSSSQKIGEDKRSSMSAYTSDNSSSKRQYDYLRSYDSIKHLSSGITMEVTSPDAASEKDLGNEYFKQKKFKEAIDCYSRSIGLSPTAVAYANRAMANLKIRRFQEAEDDCTEALNLDDRYIKAYSRRSTARKELGKLKESIEDADFALRLEPNNQEIKKQYAEAKSLFEKEMLKKASGSFRSSVKGGEKAGKSKVEVNGHVGGVQSVSSSSQKMGVTTIQEDPHKDTGGKIPANAPMLVVGIEGKSTRSEGQESDASLEDTVQSSGLESSKRNQRKKEPNVSLQELAARAASLAKVEAAKNIVPPISAYQFEVSWRGLAGDRTLQARLLKVTSPVSLPQIFKNALSAPLLIDIIRCIATFFIEETDLAVKFLENLAKVSRFDMIIMCLSSTERADLNKIWEEVFCSNAIPMGYAERLDKLQSRYCHKQ
ncbi:hypothetical protein U1Q18_035708 [Sarracenia purpurea var. burkii]